MMGDMMQTEFKHEGHIVSSSEIATDVTVLKEEEEGASIPEQDAGAGTALAPVGIDEANIVRPASAETPRAHAQSMDNERLADFVEREGWGFVLLKLRELQPYIEVLWERFDNLKKGETIADCQTKEEFCNNCLHRSMRAVQYMIYGRPPRKPGDPSARQISASKLEKSLEAGSNENPPGDVADMTEIDAQPLVPVPYSHSDQTSDETDSREEAGKGRAAKEWQPVRPDSVPDLRPGTLDELGQRLIQMADTNDINNALKSFFEGLAQSLLERHAHTLSARISIDVCRTGEHSSGIMNRIHVGDWVAHPGKSATITKQTGKKETLGRVVRLDESGRPRVRWHGRTSWTKAYSLTEESNKCVRVLFDHQAATLFPEAFASYPDDDCGASKEPPEERAGDGVTGGQSAQKPVRPEACHNGCDSTSPAQGSLFGPQPAAKAPDSEPAIPEADAGKVSQSQVGKTAQVAAIETTPTAGPFRVKKRISGEYVDFIVIRNGHKVPEDVFEDRAEAEAFCEDLNARCHRKGSVQRIDSPSAQQSTA